MSNGLTILVDLDGVLADFDGALFSDTADFIDWPDEALSRSRRFCTDYLNRREAKVVRRYIEETRFFRDLPLIPGAQGGVKELEELGHDLWICTKPLEANPWCASDKMAWVADHFPSLAKKVILAPDKSMVKGDILLDDAHKPFQRVIAPWVPVWYPYLHNQEEGRSYWKWGQDPAILEGMAHAWSAYYEEAI